MIERHLTRLPVVAGEQVVGIVSRTDLLRPLVRDDSAIAQEAALRLADVPGPWTAQVDGGVLTLTGNGRRRHRTPGPHARLGSVRGRRGPRHPASTQCLAAKEVDQMRRLGPDAGGRPTETVTLSCDHRLTDFVNHPLVLPGSSIRCPTCSVLRTVSRVESSPMLSGSASSEHNDTARQQKILIFDDG